MFSTKEGRVESIETVPDTENDPIKQPYYITNSHTAMNENKVQELQDVVIRFSGDSGDGMPGFLPIYNYKKHKKSKVLTK